MKEVTSLKMEMSTSEEMIQQFDIPRDGKVLLPTLIDSIAECQPYKLHAEYPVNTQSYAAGYRQITYSDLANAINGVAWWLHKTLGPSQGSFEKLAYIGPNDLRYPVLVLGAVKAGYVMFLPSPRNSVTAQVDLIKKLDCKIMLSPTPQLAPTTAILSAIELRVLEVPTVSELLDVKHSHFPYDKSYELAFLEPIFAVHTSGSTGSPKPIIYTHQTGARNMAMMMLDSPEGYETLDSKYSGKRVFITFPPFHGAYLDIHLFNAIPFGTVMILPTSTPVSAIGVVEGLKKTKADIAFTVPSIVQELGQDHGLLDFCVENLDMIIYSGGDLPQAIGDIVADKIKLANLYGSLELGIIALLQPKAYCAGDWKYVGFHPDIGVDLRYTSDGIYGLYIKHDLKLQERQPTSSLFPGTEEFSTKDLFIRHPSNTHLWKWYARADDLILFLNGEKTNPISMEQHIVARNPDKIRTALVMGSHHFQAALLIDPTIPLESSSSQNGNVMPSKSEADFMEEIWPSVEEANQNCPAHARITRSHVFFTKLEKKVLIAGKGTVQRAGTLALYKEELEALYSAADNHEIGEEDTGLVIDVRDEFPVPDIVRKLISTVMRWAEMSDQDDLFTLGMDSLQALMIIRELRQKFALPSLAIGTLYTNPSISQLSDAIRQLSLQGQVSQTSNSKTRYQIRHEILDEFCAQIDEIANSPLEEVNGFGTKDAGGQVVVLTGSTGALGSYILDNLLSNPEIEHIYCLNRSPQSVQIVRNQNRNLPVEFPTTRVTFLTCDLSSKNLGLSAEIYHRISKTVTLTIHNAWPVNFNLSLPSFKPHFRGLVNILDLNSSRVGRSSRLFFISSIASVMNYRTPQSRTPECVIRDDIAPGPHGYAESKYISELLLEYAASKLRVNVAYARVGQIAGAVNSRGCWKRDEWFPSLVISSLHLGMIPKCLGPNMGVIDWTPIDLLAGILTELALGNKSKIHEANGQDMPSSSSNLPGTVEVFHPLNPHVTTWDVVRPIFVEALCKLANRRLETVELDVWLGKVREDMEIESGESLVEGELEAVLRRNPAFKLLNFYEEVMESKMEAANVLERTETLISSKKLRELDGRNSDWVRKWTEQIYMLS